MTGKDEVARGSSRDGYDPGDWFWDSRKKEHSLAGTATFTILRILDLPFQYWLLNSGAGASLLRKLGGTAISTPRLSTTISFIRLSPYHSIIFSLAVGSSLKQIYWKLFVGEQLFGPSFATGVSVYNTLLNSFNTILALWTLTSQQPADDSSFASALTSSPTSLKVGIALYAIGLFVEWYAEVQRKRFKKDPRNRGKPYSGGLWSFARNINYGGYTLWRGGYSLICGGWIWAAMMTAWLAGDFINRAIPSMDAYCEKKYGRQWQEVRSKVPYKLLPWIY